MDDLSKKLATGIGAVTVICLTVLISLGKSDVVVLGVITSVALQVVTWLSTQTVAKRVNGHMTTLLASKTQPDNPDPVNIVSEPAVAEKGTNPNV
jgi:hypothetical protein